MSQIDNYLERLTAERNRAWNEQKSVLEAALAEGRDLSAEEREKVARTDEAIDSADADIRSWTERQQREAEADAARAIYEPVVRPEVQERQAIDEFDAVTRFLKGESRTLDVNFQAVANEKRALRAGLGEREARDLLKVTAAAGGNTVPTSFIRSLYDYIEIYSGVRNTNVKVLTTAGGENLEIPTVAVHGTAAIVGEGTALAEADPTFGKVTMYAWKYGQLVQLSRELLEDSGVDVLGFIAQDMGRALARVTDTAYVSGTGTNQPTGFTAVAGTGVTGQNGATGLPSYANLVDMVYSVNEGYRQNAQWIWRDATAGNIRKVTDTTNRPLWEPSLQAGQPDRLLGYPVVTDPNLNAMATGVVCGAFGDFSGFYIRDVGSIRMERSDEFAFSQDLVTFRAVMRTDSKLVDSNALKLYRGGTA